MKIKVYHYQANGLVKSMASYFGICESFEISVNFSTKIELLSTHTKTKSGEN